MIWNNADDFYIGGIQIITVVLIGLILAPLVPTYPIFGGLTLAFLLLLLPGHPGGGRPGEQHRHRDLQGLCLA